MSTERKKKREKVAMRNLILNGARKVFLEKGHEHTSIRNIAEEISYSPGIIYFYFKDKDEIFHALHEEGFRQLHAGMQVLEHVEDPFERLKAMGSAFLDYGRHNKDFYDLMFIVEAPLKNNQDQYRWQMGVITLDYLKTVVRQCQQANRFKEMDTDYLSFTILSLLHGMCALYCKDRANTFPDKSAEDLLHNGYKNFIKMLEKL